MPDIASNTNDGYCAQGLNSWVDARAGAGNGFDSNNNQDANAVWQFYHLGRGTYGIYRAFFEFDTSGIADAPSEATLKIRGYSRAEGDVIVIKSEQGASLAAGDFNSFEAAILQQFLYTDGNGAGSLAGVSDVTYSAEITTWDISGYNDIALNATALSDIASLDLFKVCLMNHDNDYKDQDGTTQERNGFYWAEDGGSNRPYIDYTPGVVAGDDAIFFGCNF